MGEHFDKQAMFKPRLQTSSTRPQNDNEQCQETRGQQSSSEWTWKQEIGGLKRPN